MATARLPPAASSPGRTLDLLDPRLAALGAIPMAFAVGAIFAIKPILGVAVVLAFAYATIVTIDLPLALVLYVPLTFLQTVKFPGVGPSAIGIIILLAWLGGIRSGLVRTRSLLNGGRTLPALVLLLLFWNLASVVWAPEPSLGLSTFRDWARAVLLFCLLVTTVRTVRDVRLLMAMFILGAVAAILASVITGGLHTAQSYDGRLTGTAGDPNYLATGIVPAVVLAIALLTTTSRRTFKFIYMAAVVILALGFAATESRGGLVGAVSAAVCALILFPRRRMALLGALAALVVIIGIWFASDPAALTRITNFNSSGDGRSDLWTVALRVWHDHVIAGVGLNNFLAVEAHYVARPGALTSLALIVNRPHVVHNVYLEALVDTGLIGVVVLLATLGCLLRASVQASRRALQQRLDELNVLSRSVVVATVGVLVSLFFLSDGPDLRLWVLFAMGPVMLGLVSAQTRAGPVTESHPSVAFAPI